MSNRGHRLILAVLAVSAGYVGFWAALAPRSFYTSFPGGGRQWVGVDGPFNEHLIRDVGALNLALLVLSIGAAVQRNPRTTRLVGATWLVFSVPHLAYHSAHLDIYRPVDQVLNVVALGTVVLAALLLLPALRRSARDVTSEPASQSS